MPRISTRDIEDTPKRAPRRQVVRKTSTRTRKAGVVASSNTVTEERVDDVPTRKAPAISLERRAGFRPSRKIVAFGGVFMAVLATAIWIGTSDNGQINVASKIEERNAQIANGEFTSDNSSGTNGNQIIPVQSGTPTVPNGGLKGRGVGSASASQQASVATASTTEATASSTEATTTEAVGEAETQNETPAGDVNTENESNNQEANTENGANDGVNSDAPQS